MHYFLALLSIMFAFQGFSQHKNFTIIEGKGACEPSVYINPNNLSNVVIGAVLNHQASSFNWGETWESQKISSTLGVWGDPCIVADSKGHFYYFHLSKVDSGSFIDRLVCQKSLDGGKTWSDGVAIGLNGKKAQDKEWAVVCPKTDNIYLTWTQFDGYKSENPADSSIIRFSKSTDGGISFSEPKRINYYAGNCADDKNTVEGAVPAVGPNGEIYVAWAGPKGLVFNRSFDGGETWLNREINIDDMPGGWRLKIPGLLRCNGFPVTVVDNSNGPFKGRIYVLWGDARNGENNTDIFLKYSDNHGETWSPLIKVNNDRKEKHQFFPWLSVDPVTGYLYVIFYDRRNHNDNKTDVYLAVSKNGAKSFKNHQISETAFTPTPDIFFGDYNNIHVYNGFVATAWTHLNNGNIAIKTALIDNEKLGVKHWEVKPTNKSDNLYKQTFKVYKNIPVSVWISNYDNDKNLALIQQKKKHKNGKLKLKIYTSTLGLAKGHYWLNLQYDDGSDLVKLGFFVD